MLDTLSSLTKMTSTILSEFPVGFLVKSSVEFLVEAFVCDQMLTMLTLESMGALTEEVVA